MHAALATSALGAAGAGWAAAPDAAAEDRAASPTDQVLRGPVPAWVSQSPLLDVPADASGLIFLRNQDVLAHLDADGQQNFIGYRMRLLHPNALQAGNLAIRWNPQAGAPTVHSIQRHRGNETVDILATSEFEILRREDQLEQAVLDGLLTAVLRVPDLRVGDELEVAYTTRISDPTLKGQDAGVLFMAPTTPPGRFRLGLSWKDGFEPVVKPSADLATDIVRGSKSVDLRLDNPPPVQLPKDAPPRFAWIRALEFSDFRDWRDISRQFAAFYGDAASLPAQSPVRHEARKIAAAHATPMARAAAALKLVQQDVRYIFVGLNGGNLKPATADQSWDRRYGDCKGKTVLLLALLDALGIEAQAVLVNNSGSDDGLDQHLPTVGMFDHVLVRATIDGKAYFMDGTLPPVAVPSIKPVLPYRWILPLTNAGQTLERVSWSADTRPDDLTLYEIDARAGFDQPARIVSTQIVGGMAALQMQAQMSALSPSELTTAMQQQMLGDTWQAIDDVKWRFDEPAQVSVLTISGTGKVDWETDRQVKSLALPGGGFNPPERRIRGSEHDAAIPFFNAPSFDCHVTTVRLPVGTQARQWSYSAGFDTRMFGRNYYRVFDVRSGALRMIRSSRVEQTEVDSVTVKRDNDRIAAFDNSMGYIYHDPRDDNSAAFGKSDVPATFERDWLLDSTPCLAPSARPGAKN